jgi:DNA-binding transcriptional MerR regulator
MNSESSLFKLKDFCRISNLSRKTLLLYEKKRILVPEKIDEETGYRYYGLSQIRTASILAFLRNFQIPLDDLGGILSGSVRIDEYFSRTRKKADLLRQQIRVSHALQTLTLCEKNGDFLNDEVQIMVKPACSILCSEGRGASKDIALYFALLFRYMGHYGIASAGAPFTYFFPDSTSKRLHFKTCCPLPAPITIMEAEIRCEKFPEVKVAFMRHFGDYAHLAQTYTLFNQSMTAKKWKSSGEYIETYLVSGDPKYADTSSFITEVAGVLS